MMRGPTTALWVCGTAGVSHGSRRGQVWPAHRVSVGVWVCFGAWSNQIDTVQTCESCTHTQNVCVWLVGRYGRGQSEHRVGRHLYDIEPRESFALSTKVGRRLVRPRNMAHTTTNLPPEPTFPQQAGWAWQQVNAVGMPVPGWVSMHRSLPSVPTYDHATRGRLPCTVVF